jgi:hypothetical protein
MAFFLLAGALLGGAALSESNSRRNAAQRHQRQQAQLTEAKASLPPRPARDVLAHDNFIRGDYKVVGQYRGQGGHDRFILKDPVTGRIVHSAQPVMPTVSI